MSRDLRELENIIGYQFFNPDLLAMAMSHSSYVNEQKTGKRGSNERLEFLGDAVLELVISDYLYGNNKEMSEGELTKTRAEIVCENSLAFFAGEIKLGSFLRLGKGELLSGGAKRASITADGIEALIGAIYIDGGIEKARIFIDRFVIHRICDVTFEYDNKSILQEMIQKRKCEPVSYELISEEGPDHDKSFVTAVHIGTQVMGTGTGKTKKASEQAAARECITRLQGIEKQV